MPTSSRRTSSIADLLFVGTELGLWVSLDGGTQWAQYKGGEMPNVAVRDLAIHPRDHALVIATHGRGIWIVDDITPLRSLTAEMMAKDAAFVPSDAVVQRIFAFGGWGNGDAVFEGPNPPTGAQIVYYQRKRHVFGDLTIEVFGPDGKKLADVPSSKRRGLSRAGWSMRLKPPHIPPAAMASGGFFGPRVLPGVYTVRMTKDKTVFETKIHVVADPRSKHTPEDRKAEFDLAMRLYGMLGDMTYAVDRINGVRTGLEERAGKLPAGDPLAAQLRADAGQVDALRKKIVATTEGGAITGEERLREYLLDLYDGVVLYEGRPSQMQVDRTASLGRELSDVVAEFDAWTAKNLSGINDSLKAKSLPAIELLTRPSWEKERAGRRRRRIGERTGSGRGSNGTEALYRVAERRAAPFGPTAQPASGALKAAAFIGTSPVFVQVRPASRETASPARPTAASSSFAPGIGTTAE